MDRGKKEYKKSMNSHGFTVFILSAGEYRDIMIKNVKLSVIACDWQQTESKVPNRYDSIITGFL